MPDYTYYRGQRVPRTYVDRLRGESRETRRRASSAQAYETLKGPTGGVKGPIDTKQDVISPTVDTSTDARPMTFGSDRTKPKK